jgi:hypothetical protein
MQGFHLVTIPNSQIPLEEEKRRRHASSLVAL